MKTKYYRYLFHRVIDGVCYSGSLTDQMNNEAEMFLFLYLAGGEHNWQDEENFAVAGECYDLMILGDFGTGAIARAKKIIEKCRVKTVLYPDQESQEAKEMIQFLKEHEVEEVRAVKEREELEYCREKMILFPVVSEGKRTLVLYHQDQGEGPEKEECVMSIKPSVPDQPCQARQDVCNLDCDLKCALYQDFTLCKKQNQKGGKYFVDGHLLMGTADYSICIENLARDLDDMWSRIRFYSIPDQCVKEKDIPVLQKKKTTGFQRYYVGTARTNAEVMKAVAVGDAWNEFYATKQDAGLCVSGYYIQR